MTVLAAIVLLAGTVALGVPLLFWSVEILVGVTRRVGVRAGGTGSPRHAVAVLIPAHNEQAVLGRTLSALHPQLGPDDRVLVVADNCTDGTAEIARAHGADVTERADTDRRGKGYALDHGLRIIRNSDPVPDAVVIFDADCAFAGPDQLAPLAAEAVERGVPVQSRYLIEPPEGAAVGDRISAFAIAVKNVLRPLGLRALGGPCLITGTGIALPAPLLDRIDLASGDIVEDMRLGVDAALAGAPPRLSDAALVRSVLPASDSGRRTQRTRWEHGHLRSIAAHAPRLVARTARRPRLLLLAMELAVPPFSLLVMLAAAWFAVVAGAAVVGLAPVWLVWVNAGLAALAGLATLAAWLRVGRRYLPPVSLAAIPWWVLKKLAVYASFARGGERAWVRTDRAGADPGLIDTSPGPEPDNELAQVKP